VTAGLERLARGLEEAGRADLRRSRRVIAGPQGPHVREGARELLNFSSNDYLGLANHPALRAAAHAVIEEYGVGAGASPLVSGHLAIHQQAEERFARFAGFARALLFGNGYVANLGILTALADRGTEIFADKLNHACLNDGALLSNARFTRYAHGDLEALERRLSASGATTRIVATDAVFSMDGDIAPVPALLELCERHDAWLVLDDAHGVGVLGATGRGTLEHFGARADRIVYMATLGKALGGHGAFVAAAPVVIDWLVQRARTYIYSTAPPPMAAGVAIAALDLLEAEPQRVAALRDRVREFRAACASQGIALADSPTAIQPVPVRGAARALEVSRRLHELGFLVPAIRPPTVPEGTSRLRVSLCAAHAPEDVRSLASALSRALAP
jgi:8-amino-7-oxononanoate synthase